MPSCLLSKNTNCILPAVLYGYKIWFLPLNHQHKLQVLRIFWLQKEVTGWWSKMYNEELPNLYSLHFIRTIKFRWMRCASAAISPFWGHTCYSVHTCFPMVCFVWLAPGCQYEQWSIRCIDSCLGWQSNNKFLTNLFIFTYLMVTINNFTRVRCQALWWFQISENFCLQKLTPLWLV